LDFIRESEKKGDSVLKETREREREKTRIGVECWERQRERRRRVTEKDKDEDKDKDGDGESVCKRASGCERSKRLKVAESEIN
jgi:hypothetical protein